jgi:signal transduction histidine kinase
MELKRRNLLVCGILFAVWALVVGWQVEEHIRVREAAKTELRNRSREIANTLSAVVRALRFRGAVLQERLEPVLNELVSGHTNELANTTDLISIVLLNTAGKPVVAAGRPIDFGQRDIIQQGEHWGTKSVTFVNPVEGATLRPEGASNAIVVLPPFRDFTNTMPDGGRDRGSQRRGPRPEGRPDEHGPDGQMPLPPDDSGERDRRSRDGDSRPRRPQWLRWMDESEYESLVEKRELHGLVLAMSTESFRAVCVHDLWLRCVIGFFATVSALGMGVAWGNLAKSSDLQLRLVRASEMNSHLRELNLAAAGLAHETRNPLNIIRGMAQMISKQPEVAPAIREKTRAILDETDKVTAQLNEFMNYSRPREVRRTPLALTAAINEVVRALGYDIEEKKVRLEIKGENISIEADEQMLRQGLFNLLLNAIQAVETGGEIQVFAARQNSSEGLLEIRDNGPGVPPERRQEIFKPYFTMQQKGTGLGLAVVQQITLAHGWEIECLPNAPRGAIFRVTHLKLAAKG